MATFCSRIRANSLTPAAAAAAATTTTTTTVLSKYVRNTQMNDNTNKLLFLLQHIAKKKDCF